MQTTLLYKVHTAPRFMQMVYYVIGLGKIMGAVPKKCYVVSAFSVTGPGLWNKFSCFG